MRSRRYSHRKKGIRPHVRQKCAETVYVPSPCCNECSDSKCFEDDSLKCGNTHTSSNTSKKTSKTSHGFNLKGVLGNLFGKSNNDDVLIIILIAIVFLSRRKTDDDCVEKISENKEFSVTDFLSKVSDILSKFDDNDILLIALLYILL